MTMVQVSYITGCVGLYVIYTAAASLLSVHDSIKDRAARGGHYHRSRVTICDRYHYILIAKNGIDHVIFLTITA